MTHTHSLPHPAGGRGCAVMNESYLMTSFTDLGLIPALLKAVATEGYTSPTPIQVQAIPLAPTTQGQRDQIRRVVESLER